MHERLHRFQIVVHAGKQDALVPQRNPGIGQTLERFFHFDGQLARMIHVHAHPKRMIFRQHRAKLRRDPLRKENRDPRADAEKFDVRNRPQSAQKILEFTVAE